MELPRRPAAPARQVACPACGKAVAWVPESAFRPFCSARCKQIDLGAWAQEEYRVPGAPGSDLPETLPER